MEVNAIIQAINDNLDHVMEAEVGYIGGSWGTKLLLAGGHRRLDFVDALLIWGNAFAHFLYSLI